MTIKSFVGWGKEGMDFNIDYYQKNYNIDPANLTFWAFRDKRGRDWAYAVTVGDESWKNIREGHIRSAIADGDIPVKITRGQMT